MNKVIHLIPYEGTGGVEVAARSMKHLSDRELQFSVQFIYPSVSEYSQRKVTYGLRPLLKAFLRIRAQRPDLVIVSLWRACLVAVMLKLASPRTRLVLMLHSTRDAHRLDRVFTNITARLADEWWGDSAATINERLDVPASKPRRVISFVTHPLQPIVGRTLAPSFIFWGRISAIKGLDRALALFAAVARRHPTARFTIIGPDGGDTQRLLSIIADTGLGHSVSLLGAMDIEQIQKHAARACFYLQASRYEGMAMSVVEAMQLGLVPVVTAVGEIRNYCRDGENAILIEPDERAVEQVLCVLEAPDRFRALQQQAVATWQGKPLYSESMLSACRQALAHRSTEPGSN